ACTLVQGMQRCNRVQLNCRRWRQVPGTTLKDVAQMAGVSIRTVSNVVNGYPSVSPRLREKVLAAIDKLEYRPNLVARNLRTGRTGLIALVVPEIDVPYFSE